MSSQCLPDKTPRARIEAEYREMPGLSLTAEQAARLFGLGGEQCAQVLGELIEVGFLRCGTDGRYCHHSGGDISHWRQRLDTSDESHVSADRSNERASDGVDSESWYESRRAAYSADPERLDLAADPCAALAAIVGAAARADGSVLPCESDRVEHTLSALPVFRGRSEEERAALIEWAVERRPDEDRRLMQVAATALPAALRGTAFAIGIDVLLADGRLRPSELRFVENLRRLLGVRRTVARKMLAVLGTKNLVWTDTRLGA